MENGKSSQQDIGGAVSKSINIIIGKKPKPPELKGNVDYLRFDHLESAYRKKVEVYKLEQAGAGTIELLFLTTYWHLLPDFIKVAGFLDVARRYNNVMTAKE